MKGGYQIISFASYQGGVNEKVKDAYKKASTGKAILIEDFPIEDVGRTSFFACAVPIETGISVGFNYGTVSGSFTIDVDDTITIGE